MRQGFSLLTFFGFLILGIAAGISLYLFVYAEGFSYFSDKSSACINCHVMNEVYSGWLKSSHRAVAACNHCHTPSTFMGKYWTKAKNGFRHSFAFTTGRFLEPISITKENHEIANQSCLSCHKDLFQHPNMRKTGTSECTHCHTGVGHQ